MKKSSNPLRRRTLAIAVAAVVGLSGSAIALAAVPAGGSFATLTRATQLGQGAVVHGALPVSQTVHVTVTLKLRNPGGLKTFLARPGHGAMSRSQLAAHYLPTHAQAQAVAAYLKQAGFRNVRIHSGNMLVSGDASAAAAQAAFKTTLVKVRTRDGRSAFANSSAIQVPASLRGTVQAVLGLQTVHKAHTLARPHRVAGASVTGHNPLEFADIYGASGLPPATDIDTGVWGWGSMAETISDLGVFIGDNGLNPVTTHVVCTDYNGFNAGGVVVDTDPTCNNFDQGSIEWDLDSQDIVAMTGGVKSMTFYAAYGGYNSSITNSLNEIVTPTAGETRPAVINASFGECERYQDANQGGDGSAQSNDALFQVAASQGVTFSVSTGDSGANNCGFGNPLNSASYPASSPWVVAASGTTLRASTTEWARENVWISSGGSPSSFELAQPWQTDLTYGTFAGARGPDIAFDGNPSSGAIIFVSAFGGYVQVGGTSLSAPLFAGAWARILQGNPSLGFAAPHLYSLPADALHDVRSGNNHGYLARRGWDWASGLGSFDVGVAAQSLGAGGGGGGTVLQNGVPITGLSGGTGGQLQFTVDIPAGATNLVVTTSGGTGDADLYVSFGTPPTLTVYDCRDFSVGNNGTCSFGSPQTGTYFVMVNGFTAFSGLTIEATWSAP